jgi:hypothetical protein
MQDNEQKTPINRFEVFCEIVFLTILAIAIYIGGTLFLGKPIAHLIPWFFGPIGVFAIIFLDVMYIVGMKTTRVKTREAKMAKKIISVFVFALSASLLTLWLILFLWSRFQW